MRYQAKLIHKPRQFVALLAALAGGLLMLYVGGMLLADAGATAARLGTLGLVALTLAWMALTGLSQAATVVWTVSGDAIHESISPRFPRLPFGLRAERAVALDRIRRWHVERAGFGSEQREVIVFGLDDQTQFRMHSHRRSADPAFIALVTHFEERFGPMHRD